MTKRITTLLQAILLALAVLFSLAAAADARCLSPREAKTAIQNKQFVTIRKALNREGLRKVRVVRAKLCPPYYVVTVLDKKGRLSTYNILATR